MKILVIGIQWPAETFIQRLLSGLHGAGHEITVVCRQRPEAQSGLKWFHPFVLRFQNLKKWDVLYFAWNSAAIENLDLLDRGVPSIVSCRGSQVYIAPHNPERVKMAEGLRKTFQKVSAVHCVSNAIKHEALNFDLAPRKAFVIYPAVDTGFFCPPVQKNKNRVLNLVTVGGLNWVKGHEYLLMAAKKLKDQNIQFRLEIIGEGRERQRVLYTIDDLGIKDQVVLAGKLKTEEIKSRLQSSDIFVCSSVSEGISNAALEAMSCGLPLVTTDCGGMREAVTDGVEGFVVPVRDSAGMTLAVMELLKSETLRSSMGISARKKVLEKFRLETQIKSFIELFEKVKEGSSCAA